MKTVKKAVVKEYQKVTCEVFGTRQNCYKVATAELDKVWVDIGNSIQRLLDDENVTCIVINKQ